MKTIVVGSRRIEDYQLTSRAIELAPWTITEVVSGCARGGDRLGERWAAAQQHSSEGVSRRVGASWKGSGLSAQRTDGPVRRRVGRCMGSKEQR
jgi:hypothetical protein